MTSRPGQRLVELARIAGRTDCAAWIESQPVKQAEGGAAKRCSEPDESKRSRAEDKVCPGRGVPAARVARTQETHFLSVNEVEVTVLAVMYEATGCLNATERAAVRRSEAAAMLEVC